MLSLPVDRWAFSMHEFEQKVKTGDWPRYVVAALSVAIFSSFATIEILHYFESMMDRKIVDHAVTTHNKAVTDQEFEAFVVRFDSFLALHREWMEEHKQFRKDYLYLKQQLIGEGIVPPK